MRLICRLREIDSGSGSEHPYDQAHVLNMPSSTCAGKSTLRVVWSRRNVPVSNQLGKLRVAVASEQLYAVCRHGDGMR